MCESLKESFLVLYIQLCLFVLDWLSSFCAGLDFTNAHKLSKYVNYSFFRLFIATEIQTIIFFHRTSRTKSEEIFSSGFTTTYCFKMF